MVACQTSQMVTITSDVEGATVYINGENVGTTPVDYEVSTNVLEQATVVLEKEGYESITPQLKTSIRYDTFVLGIFTWIPLLYIYVPDSVQHFRFN